MSPDRPVAAVPNSLIPPPLVGGGWGRGLRAPARQRIPRASSPTERRSHTRLPARPPPPSPRPRGGGGIQNAAPRCVQCHPCPRIDLSPMCPVPPTPRPLVGGGLGAGSARGSAP